MTADDIQRVAGELFRDDVLRLAVVAPRGHGLGLDEALRLPGDRRGDGLDRSAADRPSQPAPSTDGEEPDAGGPRCASERPADLRVARLHLRPGSQRWPGPSSRRWPAPAARRRGPPRPGRGPLADRRPDRRRRGRRRLHREPAARRRSPSSSPPRRRGARPPERGAPAGRPGASSCADGPLDPVFAGMPRSVVWPTTPAPAVPAAAGAAVAPRRGRPPVALPIPRAGCRRWGGRRR